MWAHNLLCKVLLPSDLSDPSFSLFLSPREEQEAEYILNLDLVFPSSPWRSEH